MLLKSMLARVGISPRAWERWAPAKAFRLDGTTERPRAEVQVQQSGDEATIYVYDIIGYDPWFGGIAAEDFATSLDSVQAPKLYLRINSPGGDVFDGRAMQDAIRRKCASGCSVVACIDGLCASAATFLAMACAQVRSSQGGMFMVHNAWGGCMGNKNDMRATADLLDKIDQGICADYAKKSEKDPAECSAWMDAETWFSADEAKAAGLVDEIEAAGDGSDPAEPAAPESPEEGQPEPDQKAMAFQARRDEARRYVNFCKDVTA